MHFWSYQWYCTTKRAVLKITPYCTTFYTFPFYLKLNSIKALLADRLAPEEVY